MLKTINSKKLISIFVSLALVLLLIPASALSSTKQAYASSSQESEAPVGKLKFSNGNEGEIYDLSNGISTTSEDFPSVLGYQALQIHIDDNDCLHLFAERASVPAEPAFGPAAANPAESSPELEMLSKENPDLKLGDSSFDSSQEDNDSNLEENDKTTGTDLFSAVASAASGLLANFIQPTQKAYATSSTPGVLSGTFVFQARPVSGKVFKQWKVTQNGKEIDLTPYTKTDKNYETLAQNDTDALVISAEYTDGTVFEGNINWTDRPDYDTYVSLIFVDNNGNTYYPDAELPSKGETMKYKITVPQDVDGTFYCSGTETEVVQKEHKKGEKSPDFALTQISREQMGLITGIVKYEDSSGDEWPVREYYVFASQGDTVKYFTHFVYDNTGLPEQSFWLPGIRGQQYDVTIVAAGFGKTVMKNVKIPQEPQKAGGIPIEDLDTVELAFDSFNYCQVKVNLASFKENEVTVGATIDGTAVDPDELGSENPVITVHKNSHYSLYWQNGRLTITNNNEQEVQATDNTSASLANQMNNLIKSSEENRIKPGPGKLSFEEIVISPTAKEGYTFYSWDQIPLLGQKRTLQDEGYFNDDCTLSLNMQECGYLSALDPDKIVKNYTYTVNTQEFDTVRKVVFDKIEKFEMMCPSELTVVDGNLVSKFTETTNDEPYYYNFAVTANLNSNENVDKWIVNGKMMNNGDTMQVSQNDKINAQPVPASQDQPTTDATTSTKTSDFSWLIIAGVVALCGAAYISYKYARRRAEK